LKGDIYLGIRSQPSFVERCTLIGAAKLTDVEPQAWLANALARLQNHPAKYIDELLPWNRRSDHAGGIRRILNHT
jgi:transposase IS66-like protein